jgi:hypothetical protein
MWITVAFVPDRYEGTIARPNPFTGVLQQFPNPQPIREEEVAAVRAVLTGASASEPNDEGVCTVRLSDGNEATVLVANLATGCQVTKEGELTAALVRLLFDILVAGNWVVDCGEQKLAANLSNSKALRPEDVVLTSTVEELAAQLAARC